ncbi:MAG TPA: efflux RND transporter periplasmic adaptor subunit [Steroidobacteraceae bacterium]|nr:efflux RND transporter periplasmic adaptor subunit [Steroidobacteraceae bacterium]
MHLESSSRIAGEGGAPQIERAPRRSLLTRRPLVAIAIAIVALALAGAWHWVVGHRSAAASAKTAAPVRIAKVVRRDMPVVEHTVGTVLANVTVQVTARVQGTLESAFFTEGQFVSRGELLFQIDPRPFKAAYAQARAVLLRDEAQLRNARRDERRYETLSRQNSISPQQADASATNVGMLTATVAADRAAARLAQLNLDYTQIRSPIEGKTGPVLVHPGNLVDLTGATPLLTIEQIEPVKLSFSLPESDLPRIQARRQSHALIATVEEPGGAPLSAPVEFVSNAVNGQSGTIELRATFANASRSLVPGQLMNVTVQLADIPHALVVPDDAVNDGPDGPYVYVVARSRAVVCPVRILFDDSRNAAVAGRLQPGDEVIVEGQLRVVPGGSVHVMPPQGAPLESGSG